jgi:hypothetical protein
MRVVTFWGFAYSMSLRWQTDEYARSLKHGKKKRISCEVARPWARWVIGNAE